jgi:hypothetical protein
VPERSGRPGYGRLPWREAHRSLDERLVAAAWERQSFDPALLDALGMRVVFRGLPADAGGPDYQDAMLQKADGRLVSGDVEFHVRSSDWYRHRHHTDHSYDNVVLHVVWYADAPGTQRADGWSVPVLALSEGVEDAPDTTPGELVPHPCVAAFSMLTAQQLDGLFTEKGIQRFSERRDRFTGEMESASPDQVLYAALLEGLGFASNRAVFRSLADAVPAGWLLAQPPGDRAAILLDAAGLGPPGPLPPPARVAPDSWRLARLRPANHPALRLRGACLALERLGQRPADTLVDAVLGAERPKDLRALLVARDTEGTGIGQGRADEVMASALLPLAAAMAPHSTQPQELFLRYPSPPKTRWTRLMLTMLERAGHTLSVRNAAIHQGLHFQYHAHCRKEASAGCGICGHGSPHRGRPYRLGPDDSSRRSTLPPGTVCS